MTPNFLANRLIKLFQSIYRKSDINRYFETTLITKVNQLQLDSLFKN